MIACSNGAPTDSGFGMKAALKPNPSHTRREAKRINKRRL
jgi:hypothetical protein